VRGHTCRYSRTRLRVPPRALLACLLAPLPHTFLKTLGISEISCPSLCADPKAQAMPADKAKHGNVCQMVFLTSLIPCVNCVVPPLIIGYTNIENYMVMKKFETCRQREQQQGATAPQPMSMHGAP
jgi:hypothetical protein